MKSKQTSFWALVACLLLGGAFINYLAVAGEAHVARRALKEFPAELGGWRQSRPDERFGAATEAILRADDYVARDYSLPDGRTASLYVGYYRTQRTGATYHSPLNCMPGSGWTLSEPATVEIKPADGGPAFEANRYIIQNADSRLLLVYWYQGRGRAVADEYLDKMYTIIDSVRLRRSDGAMVRVLVPVGPSEQTALEHATAFAAQAAPHLSSYVPN